MPPSLLDRLRRRGPLPTFITIGTMKGGTSALHNYLRQHPQVCMSTKKETDYFFRPDGHDLAWYRGQFTERADQYGESSPNYTKRHEVEGMAESMHDLLPDIRLIFLARDPIPRSVSHFLHNVVKGRVRRDDFEAYFDDLDNPALLTSRYHWQLEPFVETYGLDRILVLSSEQLRDERAQTLRQVFSFIGVDPTFTSPEFDVESHVTSAKLSKAGESLDVPVMSTEQRERVADSLRPDIDAFRALVGQAFAHWAI